MNASRYLHVLTMFICLDCFGESQTGNLQTISSLNSAGLSDPATVKTLIKKVGCGSCHYIPGIKTARGQVGPPLSNMKHRAYLAGILPNNFRNMVLWIQHPQQIAPESVMPDLGLNTAEAEAIATYLYSLK